MADISISRLRRAMRRRKYSGSCLCLLVRFPLTPQQLMSFSSHTQIHLACLTLSQLRLSKSESTAIPTSQLQKLAHKPGRRRRRGHRRQDVERPWGLTEVPDVIETGSVIQIRIGSFGGTCFRKVHPPRTLLTVSSSSSHFAFTNSGSES